MNLVVFILLILAAIVFGTMIGLIIHVIWGENEDNEPIEKPHEAFKFFSQQ